MLIGDKIRLLRERKDLTQEELAQRVGTTKQTIYKYEMGIITNIPMDKIEAIAKELNCSPVYLLGWENKQLKPNTISMLGRGGKVIEKEISEDQRKAIELILNAHVEQDDDL